MGAAAERELDGRHFSRENPPQRGRKRPVHLRQASLPLCASLQRALGNMTSLSPVLRSSEWLFTRRKLRHRKARKCPKQRAEPRLICMRFVGQIPARGDSVLSPPCSRSISISSQDIPRQFVGGSGCLPITISKGLVSEARKIETCQEASRGLGSSIPYLGPDQTPDFLVRP